MTGPSAPETSTDPAGFLARIDLQNARGGVNGHKLVPLVIDDQTNPSDVATAVQSALANTANGLLPKPINYSTVFGHDPPQQCVWVLRAAKTGFVPVSAQPGVRHGHQDRLDDGHSVSPADSPARSVPIGGNADRTWARS